MARAKAKPPVHYTPELADDILARVAEGEHITKILTGEGMPTLPGFLGWTRREEGLAERYEIAREAWAEHRIGEVLDTLEKASNDPRAADVRAKHLLRLVEMHSPRYSRMMQVQGQVEHKHSHTLYRERALAAADMLGLPQQFLPSQTIEGERS
ncbi:terminase small subunit-like protein [Pacificimonas sp. ICDLI1SI03]